MTFSVNKLPKLLGKRSNLAQAIIPKLYAALNQHIPEFDHWRQTFTKPKRLTIKRLTKHYGIQSADNVQFIFALRTYYAMVIKHVAAYRLGVPATAETIEDGSHFSANDIGNFTEDDSYSWYVPYVDVSSVAEMMLQIDYSQPMPDVLKLLHHDLFPRALRHALGEYYTPDWLANFLLNRISYTGERRLLDPACGSGTFIVLAYRRLLDAGVDNPLQYLAGIDVNPLACLSAKVNLILNLTQQTDTLTLPIYCTDTLLNPPEIGDFSVIIGNPPWVNWETLSDAYREQTKGLWERYNLFAHSGFDTILGKGKKDLSLLMTYAVVDRYLREHGTLAFILTQSVLKTSGAAEGFRRFEFGDTSLYPRHVDDFSKLRIFSGAETKPIALILDSICHDPVTYTLWNADKKTIKEDAPVSIIETFHQSEFIAEPIGDIGSAWLTGKPKALQAVRKVLGQSDYTAHAGVYTGGANAVYWLEVLEHHGNKVRVRNVVEGAKRPVAQVDTWIESDFVFPLLRGRDVSKWHADPTVHILIVQNPETRQGYDAEWLQEHYPLTYDYLAQFETNLRGRATFKRYFREDAPFYTMFDIGDYTFCPYKVVWHGFGKKRMEAVVIGSVDDKPIMTNQAMHPFIGLDREDEAHFLCACLNSAPFEFAVLSHTQSGGKSFAQPGILERLRLPAFDAKNEHHQALIRLSRLAHQGTTDDGAIAQASAPIWGLTDSELQELQTSLNELVV